MAAASALFRQQVSSAITAARGQSICPARSAALVWGSRARDAEIPVSLAAARPVKVSSAAISSSSCSMARSPVAVRRRASSLMAATSPAAAQDASRRDAHSSPAISSSSRPSRPPPAARSASPASTGPGAITSAAPPAANPLPCWPGVLCVKPAVSASGTPPARLARPQGPRADSWSGADGPSSGSGSNGLTDTCPPLLTSCCR